MPRLSLLAFLAACTTATQVRLPLEGNTERAANEACYLDCRGRAAGNDDALVACLAECPVAVVTEGRSCSAADGRGAICEDASHVEGGSTALAVFAVASLTLLVVGLANFNSDGCWSSHCSE